MVLVAHFPVRYHKQLWPQCFTSLLLKTHCFTITKKMTWISYLLSIWALAQPWQKRGRGKLLVVTWNSFLPSFLPFRKEGRKRRWKGRGNAANCQGTRQPPRATTERRRRWRWSGGGTKWGRSNGGDVLTQGWDGGINGRVTQMQLALSLAMRCRTYTTYSLWRMAYKGWDLETSWFWENIKGWRLLLQMRVRDDDGLFYDIIYS